MNRPAITLSNVSKVYSNGMIALKDMNLTIGESEFISLLGPSGCGKSTVLQLIAGLISQSSGSIQLREGLSQSRKPASAKNKNQESVYKLAFVFQEAALMPWSKVRENVSLPLKLAGVSQKNTNAAVDEAISLVGLEGFERSYPRELSGGMKMRVSIARALVTKPDILLMDEPFAALDEMTRSKLNSDLIHLWNQKRWTVVFVTHNIYEAVYLSERVVVMASRPGRTVADVKIDVPHPRTEEFRTSSVHSNYCKEIVGYLSKAMENAPV